MTSPTRKAWVEANRADLNAKRRARYHSKMLCAPEKIRAERRKYAKLPRTPNERRRATMRSMLWHVVTGDVKSGYMVDLLGCTIEQMRAHLASQFQTGWTWADYGTLFEIDHIIPCREFDLTDAEQCKVCFHHTNLRPLEKAKNRAWKGALAA
jgi:hypothetical protein